MAEFIVVVGFILPMSLIIWSGFVYAVYLIRQDWKKNNKRF